MNQHPISLFCLVHGDLVITDDASDISDLQHLILEENPSGFRDIGARDIKLRKWNKSTGGVKDLDLNNRNVLNPLNPMKKITCVFKDDLPKDECIHITVPMA